MATYKFNELTPGDAMFVCEYPNYRALREHGYSKQELQGFFKALRGNEIVSHYNLHGLYIAELQPAQQ